jgi:hypothetical protein
MRHLTRERLVANLAAPAIVRAISLGRVPDRERGVPRILLRRARTRDAFSNALLYRMPAGIPGDVNRAFQSTEEPNILDSNYPFLGYGLACVMDQTDYQIRPAGGSTTTNKTDTAAVLYGLLIRPFPTNQQTTSSFFGQNPLSATQPAPPTSGLCDVLKRGYMTVLLQGATAAEPGAPVYVQVTGADANTTTDVCGGIHAAADAGCVQAGSAGTTYFRGTADSNGNVEIAWNL